MEELMASALELFGRQGYHRTSVAEITSHAGYSKGSFYRHWESKDGLFLQILEEKFKYYRGRRAQRMQKVGTFDEFLDAAWGFLEEIANDRNWAKVFLEFSIYAASVPELQEEMRRGKHRLSEAPFAELIERFVEKGYPSEKVGALTTALFEGFLVQNALGIDVLSLEDIREAAIKMVKNAEVKKT